MKVPLLIMELSPKSRSAFAKWAVPHLVANAAWLMLAAAIATGIEPSFRAQVYSSGELWFALAFGFALANSLLLCTATADMLYLTMSRGARVLMAIPPTVLGCVITGWFHSTGAFTAVN